jgi:hypothetical protein
MPALLRAHFLVNLAMDEFQSLVRPEDAQFARAVVFLAREQALGGRRAGCFVERCLNFGSRKCFYHESASITIVPRRGLAARLRKSI